MTQKLSVLSQSPYFDDFNPNKDYVRVLFRPSYPVQARELTTLQTFLQEQITRFGDNVFKDGSRVTAGNVNISTDVKRLTLTGTGNITFPASEASVGAVLATVATLEGLIVTNSDGTVKARVVRQPVGFRNQSVGSLYVKYISNNLFAEGGGYVYALPEDNPGLTQTFYNTYSGFTDATLANVSEGIYYVKGVFVRVQDQTILVDANSSTPSFHIGFSASEEIVTQNEDTTLFDNARGVTNEGSPGAHRLRVVLSFTAKAIDAASDSTFYRTVTVTEGVISDRVFIDGAYNSLIDVLARRTYDESGHYALRPFQHTIDKGRTNDTFNLTIGASKAYVRGYEITKSSSTNLVVDKGLAETDTQKNYVVPFVGTACIELSATSGILPGQNGGDTYSPASRILLQNSAGHTIGVSKGYAVLNETSGGVSKTKLYLYDIKMFTVITTTDGAVFPASVVTGNDVSSLKTKAIVYKDDPYLGVPDNLVLLNTSGVLRINQPIVSQTAGTQAVISSVLTFSTADISTVAGTTDGFTGTVVPNTFANGNSELVNTLERHIKTYRDASGQVSDNNFEVLYDTTGTALLSGNGVWNAVDFNDGVEIKKNLKFKYIKVKQNLSRAGINYGWCANDKEVSLFYTDVHKVYKISQSTNNTFASSRFERIKISTTAIIPQGATITGQTSGTVAIVALSNSTAGVGAGVLSSNALYHQYEENTNSSDTLEIVYEKGSSFTTGELLTVKLFDTTAPVIANQVTYLSNEVAVGRDVTGLFMLDDGQRAEYYDVARLYRKDNAPAPTADVVVFFSYFESAPNNLQHYYSADSYSHLDFFDVDVRYYGAIQEITAKNKNTGRDLRNSVDFRLSVQTSSDVTKSPFSFTSRAYVKQSKIIPNTTFTTDFTEYLGRVDVVMLTKDGNFVVKKGIPSNTPKKPDEVPDAMTLSTVFIPPAVRYPKDEITLVIKNNRRYTMADIGKLDDRISHVEQAVALSLLESQALHDDVGGRTKMGFVVDDFSTSGSSNKSPADFTSVEFNASIDVINKTLIPAQTSGKQLPMQISSSTNTSNFFSDYIINQFTEELLVSQTEATNTFLINPFAVWLFQGQVKLTPSEDNWFVRSDNYFISRFGELRPVSAAEFNNFGQITNATPGGVSTTVREWVGSVAASLSSNTNQNNVTQAQRTITTNIFENLNNTRGSTVETFTGTTVIENPQDYRMRSLTVAFVAKGLRPNTSHVGSFGGVTLVENLVSDNNGELSGAFTIPANTFHVGTQSFDLKDTDTQVQSSASTIFTSTGHTDNFTQTLNVSAIAPPPETGGGGDPIAQLFKLPVTLNNGVRGVQNCILTSIDLWFGFVDTRPTMDKVVVEIREAVNGYPAGPDKVLGTTGFITVSKSNQTGIPSSTNATNFKFLDPVALIAEKEYAIVIKSPSDATTVFVARIGENLINGTGIHDSQPLVGGYAGSFFKSQNESSWEADQNVDLTFRLNCAKFNTSTQGIVNLSNVLSDTGEFNGDVGAFNEGLAIETYAGSNYVKVLHPNHGLNFDGAKVRLSGFGVNTLNGIPDSDLNRVHDVRFPTLNAYFVKTTNHATETGRPPVPMFTAFATQSVVYDSMLTNFRVNRLENDTLNATVRTTTTNTSNLFTTGDKIFCEGIMLPAANAPTALPLTQLFEFDEPRIVRNLLNATGNDLQLQLTLGSGSEYSSPYFKKDTNLSPILFRNNTGLSLTDSEVESGLTVRSAIVGDDENNQKYASYLAGVQSETEFSSYVTRQIDISLPADGFTVLFDADMAPTSSVEVSYKAKPVGDESPFDDLQWVSFPADQQVNEANFGPFTSETDNRSFTLRVTTPFEFTSFKIRIRMRTSNETQIPKIKDLRVVADL